MIDIENKGIRIRLNKQFYDINVVRESLKDFKRVCSGKVANKKAIEVMLKPKEQSLKGVLGHEFCNYVLGLMKNKTLI
ncbi:HxsD-like protein [Candidatus Woesearchaeota archaeon]|nr:HxsD-like protein [Candidatus Woesearchaeota archaeon]